MKVGFRSVSFLVSLVLWVLSWSALADLASPGCVERVFGEYCLGSDILGLRTRHPDYIHWRQEGRRSALVYQNGGEQDYVMAYRGHIYKVLRQYRPATSSSYRRLREELRERFGMPRELSRFPWYARRLSTKITAIKRGEGRALLRWKPASRAYCVELSWTTTMGLSVAYIAGDGDDSQCLNGNDDSLVQTVSQASGTILPSSSPPLSEIP